MSLGRLCIYENQCVFLHLKARKEKKSYQAQIIKCFYLFKIFSFYLILSTKQFNELSRISSIVLILILRKLKFGQ